MPHIFLRPSRCRTPNVFELFNPCGVSSSTSSLVVSVLHGVIGDSLRLRIQKSTMSGYTPDEKLRYDQLTKLRRQWLKDQELSPREPVLPPKPAGAIDRFWANFLKPNTLWRLYVSSRTELLQFSCLYTGDRTTTSLFTTLAKLTRCRNVGVVPRFACTLLWPSQQTIFTFFSIQS